LVQLQERQWCPLLLQGVRAEQVLLTQQVLLCSKWQAYVAQRGVPLQGVQQLRLLLPSLRLPAKLLREVWMLP
jgi:hypothetical protein